MKSIFSKVREKADELKYKAIMPLAGAGVMAGQASAFNYAGMGTLQDVIQDIVTLFPDLITLVVYGAIIMIVYVLISFIKGLFGKSIGK